ncbi:MAG: hypothetical protein H6Q90_2607 [Deltaproteobacteria bacterium]|nr:hypothetical protein [Deltaproteobacteria bacterium]
MSSDCFDVRVQSVDGATVVFDVLTSTAGSVNDLATSRSFALLLLEDAHRRGASPGSSSLHETLEADAPEDWYINSAWMKANVGRFVQESVLVERRNNLPEAELMKRELEIEEQFGGLSLVDEDQWQPLRWERCHNYTLRVTAADPKWVQHIRPGQTFGTTAFDVLPEPVRLANAGSAVTRKPPAAKQQQPAKKQQQPAAKKQQKPAKKQQKKPAAKKQQKPAKKQQKPAAKKRQKPAAKKQQKPAAKKQQKPAAKKQQPAKKQPR